MYYSFTMLCMNIDEYFFIAGVSHGDDFIYLFYMPAYYPEFTPEDPETQMVEKLTTLWANFISTG